MDSVSLARTHHHQPRVISCEARVHMVQKAIALGLILLATTLAMWANQASARSMVYKVSKGDQQLFLAGTVHLLKDSDYPLPLEYDQAYRQSAVIGYEIDPDLMATPEAQQMMLQMMMLPADETLAGHLSKETYQALLKEAKPLGLDEASLSRMNPSAAILMLTVASLQRLGFRADKGVEMYYNVRAASDAKKEFSLENLQFQLKLLTSLADGQEDASVKYTLLQLKTLEEDFRSITQAWRSGNAEQLHGLISGMLEKDYPGMYQKLLVERNRSWIPLLEKRLATPEIETVFVGAAHLAGPESVLAMLQKRGYLIEQLSVHQKAEQETKKAKKLKR